MTSPQSPAAPPATTLIAGVRFYDIGKLYHFGCETIPDIRVGDQVVVETARGRQMGQVMSLLNAADESAPRDYKPILRRATPTDLMSQKLWKAREVEALITCREKAAEVGGFHHSKFVAAQYNFDGTLLTFLFTSEEKLNTAKLRTVLQRSFKAKVDLRQVGPRDVAKLIGGMGACGIPRCCSTFLTDFSPISIKMAKAQGISLNPSEITGMCGRLRCCLIYEYEQYVEARKQLPKRNKRVGTPHGEGKVIDVHPLRDAVTVLVEDQRHLVEREQIVPIEEFEALKRKAEAGCSKHENGGCDCGAKHEPAAEEDLDLEFDAELGAPTTDEDESEFQEGATEIEDESEAPPPPTPSLDAREPHADAPRPFKKRNKRRRARGRRGDREQKDGE